jgi:hypothetical protein
MKNRLSSTRGTGGVVRARDGSNWTIAIKLVDDQSDATVLAQRTAQALADPALQHSAAATTATATASAGAFGAGAWYR